MFGFGKNKEQIKAKVMTEEFNSIISLQIINAMIVKMIGLDTDQKIATIIFFDYLFIFAIREYEKIVLNLFFRD